MRVIKNWIPRRIKDSIKVLFGYLDAVPKVIPDPQSLFDCPVCNSKSVVFNPLPLYYFRELFENQHIHASFQAETINLEFYSCSNCYASDRDRLYALYFQKIQARNNVQKKILDIAPSGSLTQFLRRMENCSVRTADLYMEGVDDRVDITNMCQYESDSFDIFICSHVLEHIDDDIAAMRELYRVLKPGGWGIAMVPISLGLDQIYENAAIKDAAGRWKHFGQDDHVRMYSKNGFIQRLESVGFRVDQYGKEYFGADVFRINGIHHRSVLYIVSK